VLGDAVCNFCPVGKTTEGRGGSSVESCSLCKLVVFLENFNTNIFSPAIQTHLLKSISELGKIEAGKIHLLETRPTNKVSSGDPLYWRGVGIEVDLELPASDIHCDWLRLKVGG